MSGEESDSAVDWQAKIEDLKREKRKRKSAITKVLNSLAEQVSRQDVDTEEIKEILGRLEELKDATVELIDEMAFIYKDNKQKELEKKAGDEADELTERIERESGIARQTLTTKGTKSPTPPSLSPSNQSSITAGSTVGTSTSSSLSNFERIKIPCFSGNKNEFPHWHATFISCVDQTGLTAQFKMLRLESCLAGEALETIKGLGYSQAAYDVAKTRLVRKYGGNRREVQSHLDEVLKMRAIKEDNPKALEKFADMLERAIIKLQENDRKADLEVGTLYTLILEKMPEKLITQYYRWLKEEKKAENLVSLKDWAAEEAEFQMHAAELKHGLQAESGSSKPPERKGRVFGTFQPENRKRQGDDRKKTCKFCGEGQHGLWNCEVFKSRSPKDRWSAAKKLGVCYRCLANGHMGSVCPRSRACKLNGCSDSHHRLLHMDKVNETTAPTTQSEITGHSLFPASTFVPPNQPGLGTQTRENQPPLNSYYAPFVPGGQHIPRGGGITEGDANSYKTSQKTETSDNIALRTIPVILKNGSKRLLVNCFLDEGSDTTYVNEDVIEEFGITGDKEWITVNVANHQQVGFQSMTFHIGLESLDGSVNTVIKAKTSGKICGGMKAVDWVKLKTEWDHLKDIPFPPPANKGTIDVLLGTDNYGLMYPIQEVIGGAHLPYARRCPLGWTAVGQLASQNTAFNYHTRVCNTFFTQEPKLEIPDDLNVTLKRFWDLDTMGIIPPGPAMSPDEAVAMQKVSESLIHKDGHYSVAVPWRDDRPELPNNRPLAERRLKSTERKLASNPEVARAYQQVIEEYLEKEYIRKVPVDEPRPDTEWLLPHFPVSRPDKSTTKTRMVFDASAEFEGQSLNKVALPGPKLQSDILDILIRFRKEPVPVVGDVSQMYHQLELLPEDRPLHRFLWRDLDTRKEPEVYEFSRFIFGGCYGPFCAQYVWQKHAEIHKTEFPLASEAILKSCYMDDLMPSVESVEQAKEVRRQLTELGNKAGFHIRKWISPKTEVIADIPKADRAKEVDLERGEIQSTKTLGVLWQVQDDKMSFRFTPPPTDFSFTKRNVLKKIATIFDPLGLLTPYILRAKVLMQEAWAGALSWDDELPDQLKKEWRAWFDELEMLDNVKVQRCLREDKAVTDTTLHTFSDASDKSYAAVVYTRHEYRDGSISTQMVASKSRLAPMKAISIPRLELMGAITGLRLTKKVCSALELTQNKVTFWVDSDNVGFWIQGQSRNYKPFVAHRVGEIHEETSPNQWRYVPTKINPADKGTRGLSAEELATDDIWWHGPPYLQEDESKWPDRKFGSAPDAQKEVKSGQKEQTAKEDDRDQSTQNVFFVSAPREKRLDAGKYSKWYRVHPKRKLEIGLSIVRVVGWVNRYINNVRKQHEHREYSQELTPAELKEAEKQLIKLAQREYFAEELEALVNQRQIPKTSSILSLTPVCVDGILRANTRLRYSEDLPEDVKYPIILPKRHAVTKLIVKYYHELEGHQMGVNYTLNHLRERYHVVNGREAVKRCIKDCAECSRNYRGRAAQQQMAPLPRVRLEVTERPFTNCATDFAGPFYTMQGRGKARMKRYLCLFVCLQTRCCHLEMATSLETDGFLNAFTRMVARRGWPKLMLSDNGTNYVGAAREIKELVDKIDQEKVQRLTSNRGVVWRFNPPAGPHFGGVFESMIKAAKRAIYAELSGADVNDEELETVIIGAESLLNSRPLTTVSGDQNDELVLTPNHFLIGQMGGELAPESVDTTSGKLRKRWRRVQELIRKVWQRWMREYLPHIGSRHKWFLPIENLKEGDVVLEIDPKRPRRNWKIGRVVAVHPGQDGLVRVVDVRLGEKVLRRPITKLSPLETQV